MSNSYLSPWARPGDLARIEENVTASAPKKSSTKGKKADRGIATKTKANEGVVYKVWTSLLSHVYVLWHVQVSDTRIVIAIDPSDEDVDLPERCRVLKLANSVTYDRYAIPARRDKQNCVLILVQDGKST